MKDDAILYAALAGLLTDVWKFAWKAQANAPNARATSDQKELIQRAFLSEFVLSRFHGELQSEKILGFAKLASQLSETEQEDGTNTRLRSVFSRLADHKQDAFIPLARLNPKTESALFPKALDSFPSNSQTEYADLWKQFKEAGTRSKITEIQNPEQYLETLMALLQEFTWCIPYSGGALKVC
jgi:hypothetical protein